MGGTGTEPRTARGALRLRLVVARGFLPLLSAATVLFAPLTAGSGSDDTSGRGPLTVLAVVCAALALTAAPDVGGREPACAAGVTRSRPGRM